MEAAVSVRGVTKAFGGVLALNAVSLEARRGEFLSLLGLKELLRENRTMLKDHEQQRLAQQETGCCANRERRHPMENGPGSDPAPRDAPAADGDVHGRVRPARRGVEPSAAPAH